MKTSTSSPARTSASAVPMASSNPLWKTRISATEAYWGTTLSSRALSRLRLNAHRMGFRSRLWAICSGTETYLFRKWKRRARAPRNSGGIRAGLPLASGRHNDGHRAHRSAGDEDPAAVREPEVLRSVRVTIRELRRDRAAHPDGIRG